MNIEASNGSNVRVTVQKDGFYAVFIDAGYLFAHGSKIIFDQKTDRDLLNLKIITFLELITAVSNIEETAKRLRYYWYDGVRGNHPSPEQEIIARTDFVKFRAGIINSANQQKEVDTLIVTDLIELARNRVITDAVILTGDSDLRIGITIAQSYGVRAHLIGLGEGKSAQSAVLMNEVDTLRFLTKEQIGSFLSQKPDEFSPLATEFVNNLSSKEREELLAHIKNPLNHGMFPSNIDANLLRSANRSLSSNEAKLLRKRALARLKTP